MDEQAAEAIELRHELAAGMPSDPAIQATNHDDSDM
jgi:hypothetical protein